LNSRRHDEPPRDCIGKKEEPVGVDREPLLGAEGVELGREPVGTMIPNKIAERWGFANPKNGE
jgi:hypothetical protein